ncbi:MAG: hypothetical protein U0531_21930 [Dehalococcoidia bacterium]
MPAFPSVEWFQALAGIVNHDTAYRKAGAVDAEVGVQVDDCYFEIDFEAYEVTGVREIDAARAAELDFTLVLPAEEWREMIENIKQHGAADLSHTLNSLDLASADEFARSADYYRRDKFYRFNQSFQLFFDASAQIDTEFPVP